MRVHGLTSTLLSGPDDTKGKLYLGPLQTVFEPIAGVIRLVMLHHPPDWLEDCEEVEDALWNGAKIHLMRHKHRQRIRLDDAAIRLAAGAVNPSRFEVGWEPGESRDLCGTGRKGCISRMAGRPGRPAGTGAHRQDGR